MRLRELLLELSPVIRKDGFAVLQAALSNETPDNMRLRGAEACLLMTMSEMIRQQTGESIDRLSLLDALDQQEASKVDTFYQAKKYHNFDALVHQITKEGVFLYSKSTKAKFNLKMYNASSVADVKKHIDGGISVVVGWQNCDETSGAQIYMDPEGALRRITDRYIKKCKNIDEFKSAVEDSLPLLYLGGRLRMSMEHAYLIAQGIIPYIKNLTTYNSYHGVLIVGYDESQKVFIVKDIRKKYLFGGMAKLPYKYIEDGIKGKSKFIKAIVGIEAEKVES